MSFSGLSMSSTERIRLDIYNVHFARFQVGFRYQETVRVRIDLILVVNFADKNGDKRTGAT